MKRMAVAKVLISGANGLGVETAKNVILAGVRSVTLHDTSNVQLRDLSAQFYLTEGDMGKNRAEACKGKLQKLNTAVGVAASSSADLTDAFLRGFQVVVLTSASLEESKRIDNFCHSQSPPIAFIRAETRGVFASVFTDFGPSFEVLDVDGVVPHSGIIESITSGNPTLVTCVEDHGLDFQDGQLVTFSEVQGMLELNGHNPIPVKNCQSHSFQLDLDTTAFSKYTRGGIVVQSKEPKMLAFKRLAQALQEPGQTDVPKMNRSALLRVGFQALDAFEAENGHAPRPAHSADADRVVEHFKQLNEALPGDARAVVDEAILRKLAHCASSELNPMAAMFGGVVGQEVLKAVSGKFHPTFQWLCFDSIESLPSGELAAEEYEQLGSRYDAQVAVLGRSMQHKLARLKLFLVGAGALGCELLKNFAMMGVATDSPGLITVTDDDLIERSNLSRQFLFRDGDIESSKSTCASEATRMLNPDIRICALQNRVSLETESVFNDPFWQDLDLVVNALDNVEARMYVDSRCVYFNKPLLESGTQGTKCSTQTIVPHMTSNYGASRDQTEEQAPMCTLHSFPHNIEHCLTWARSEFEGLLEKTPREANAFLSDPDKYVVAIRANPDAAARDQLERVVDLLVDSRVETFEDCIAWARLRFQDYFHNRVVQLAFTFPEDDSTTTGAPFWSAPKRFPKVLVFDARDSSFTGFVQAAAVLKAEVHGIPRPTYASDLAKVGEKAAAVVVEQFQPHKGVHIETDPKAEKSGSLADDESVIEGLLHRLTEVPVHRWLPSGFKLSPVQFEKDNDCNFHMDMIAGLANLRARNYKIREVNKFDAKVIAGRIIPAIATSTAVATGLVCLELYKIVAGDKEIEDFRDTCINLALPQFIMYTPIPPENLEYKELKWSLWDRWTLEGDLSVQEVLDWFQAHSLRAYSISCGQSLLYNSINASHKERLPKKMSELVKTIAKVEVPSWRSHFDVVVACEAENGKDLDLPLLSIKFR